MVIILASSTCVADHGTHGLANSILVQTSPQLSQQFKLNQSVAIEEESHTAYAEMERELRTPSSVIVYRHPRGSSLTSSLIGVSIEVH